MYFRKNFPRFAPAEQTLSEVKDAMKINYFDDPAFLEEQKKAFEA